MILCGCVAIVAGVAAVVNGNGAADAADAVVHAVMIADITPYCDVDDATVAGDVTGGPTVVGVDNVGVACVYIVAAVDVATDGGTSSYVVGDVACDDADVVVVVASVDDGVAVVNVAVVAVCCAVGVTSYVVTSTSPPTTQTTTPYAATPAATVTAATPAVIHAAFPTTVYAYTHHHNISNTTTATP